MPFTQRTNLIWFIADLLRGDYKQGNFASVLYVSRLREYCSSLISDAIYGQLNIKDFKRKSA